MIRKTALQINDERGQVAARIGRKRHAATEGPSPASTIGASGSDGGTDMQSGGVATLSGVLLSRGS
jgi:hypothetical protein